MAAVYEMIVRAAQTDATVLLHGETGTGKGLLARAIHVNSDRKQRAVRPRRLHDAAGGARRERAVRSRARRVHRRRHARDRQGRSGERRHAVPRRDRRAAAAAARQAAAVRARAPVRARRWPRDADGRRAHRRRDEPRSRGDERTANQFRSDLYFRLRVVEISIPPLRERGADDIADLAEHFVAAVLAALSQGPAAARRLGAPCPRRVRLARQRARAREHDRARGRARSRLDDRRQGSRARSAAPDGKRLAGRHAGDSRRAAPSTASRCRRTCRSRRLNAVMRRRSSIAKAAINPRPRVRSASAATSSRDS